MPPAHRHRIVIADDRELVRSGLCTIISQQPDLQVCGFAGEEFATLEMLEQEQPDLLLLEIAMGLRDGISLIKDVCSRFPNLKILVVSIHDEMIYAPRALHAGATGYLMKTATADNLIFAIRRVLSGKTYVSPQYRLLTEKKSLKRRADRDKGVAALTDREFHVYQLIGVGLGTGRIAEELRLSRKTIECYREKIKEKLNLTDGEKLKKHAREWLSALQHHSYGPPPDFPASDHETNDDSDRVREESLPS